MYHYFLVHIGAEIYRLGVEGDRELAKTYLEKHFRDVRYIGEYRELILFDIDRNAGVGERKIDGGVIKTCKLVHRLMTRHTEGNIYEWLERVHKHIKEREESEGKEEIQSS